MLLVRILLHETCWILKVSLMLDLIIVVQHSLILFVCGEAKNLYGPKQSKRNLSSQTSPYKTYMLTPLADFSSKCHRSLSSMSPG